MTREQYDEFSAPLVRTMNDMEDEILRIVAAQLARENVSGADMDFSDTSKWRIRQLARSGELGKEAAELIASYSGVEMGEAMEAIEAAALTEIGYVDGAVADLARRGLFDSAVEIPAESSAMNAVRAFKRQAKSDLNLVNTVMMYKAKSSYVNAVNKVYFESEKSRQQALNTMGKYSAGNVMGHFSLQESTRRCIRELAEKGIPAFVDKRGREWTPESYVMMDMRSTLGNTARAAQWARCDEYGIKLVEISSHMGARPLCAKDQGKIYSRDGTSGVTTDGAGNKIPYTPLSETSYGKPDGILGINCGHVPYPFVAGCSFQSYFPYPEEENAERYKQFQKQRYMERKIRATKRECMMFNETGDTEAFKEASVRLKQQRKAYKDYSQSVGLKVHNDRTQVYGFDRSVSSKATWANRKSSGKPLTGSRNGGIIKNIELPTEIHSIAGMSKELENEINASFDRILKKYDVKIDNTPVKSLGKGFEKVPFQFKANPHGAAVSMDIVINADYDFNGSLKAFEERIKRNHDKGVLASQSVEDLLWHESVHVMTFQGCSSYNAVLELNDELISSYVKGVSGYSDSSYDGVETMAEAFVKKKNGGEIPKSVDELLNKYIERWKK